jgi:hypothetical protein
VGCIITEQVGDRARRQGIAAEMIRYNVWGDGSLSKGCVIMSRASEEGSLPKMMGYNV